jgi:hypothetical protein
MLLFIPSESLSEYRYLPFLSLRFRSQMPFSTYLTSFPWSIQSGLGAYNSSDRGKKTSIQDNKAPIKSLHNTPIWLDAHKRCEDSPQPAAREDYSHIITRSTIEIIVAILRLKTKYSYNNHQSLRRSLLQSDGYGGDWRGDGWTMVVDLLQWL